MLHLFLRYFAAAAIVASAEGNEICEQVYNVFANSPFRNLANSASDARVGQYPFAVSFQRLSAKSGKKEHVCSGALVSENRAMTSAQCAQIFKECDNEVIEAVVGAWNLTNPEEILEHQQRIPVKEVRVYPKYSGQPPPYLEHDFAFVILDHSVILNERVRPLELRLSYGYAAPTSSSSSSSSASNNTSSTPEGNICTMISWGNHYLNDTFEKSESGPTTTTERKLYPDVLQQEDLLMIGNTECNKLVGEINPVYNNMLCGVKLPVLRNAPVDCDEPHLIWKPTGDTGSALICSDENGDSYLAGLTSWGNLPCTGTPTKRITVFTRIGHYVQHQFHVPV